MQVTANRTIPLRAVDSVEITDDGSAVATKKIVETDPYLVGHYPHFTIYPGVFTLESVVQSARVLLARLHDGAEAEMVRVLSMRLTGPLRPGDELVMRLSIKPGAGSGGVVVTADCERAEGGSVAKAKLEFRLLGQGLGSRTDA
jgi:3-hydroxyacyl-[acyl-carrier-protein] dehydratase